MYMQDGRSSSLTAPHGPSQQAVIASAISEAGITAAEIAGLEMHGTGTPLGDPIEIGAASAVLQGELPLQLSAAKSISGHAEPAAGTVGIAHAVSILRHQHTSMLPHVRSPNPHVLSIPKAEGEGSQMKVPRQPGARICGEAAHAMGVSAFAFQGTNAHAILQPCSPNEGISAIAPAWKRQRFWYTVKSTAILHQAAVKQELVSFQTVLSRAALAFSLDHQIQGVALFPGAGMFDLASSACLALSGDGSTASFGLLGATIAAPLAMQAAEGKLLICTVQPSKGHVEVQSQAAQGIRGVHLKASFGEALSLSKLSHTFPVAVLPKKISTICSSATAFVRFSNYFHVKMRLWHLLQAG